MKMNNNGDDRYYTFNIQSIRNALETLKKVRSHEHFPGYLALLRDSNRINTVTNSESIVNFYHQFLSVCDAPKNRPFLRPFRSRGVGNPITLYQQNVAGSYAPSSIRKNGPLSKILNINNETERTCLQTELTISLMNTIGKVFLLSGSLLGIPRST